MVRVFALASIVEALASADVRTVGVLCATVVVVAVLATIVAVVIVANASVVRLSKGAMELRFWKPKGK